MLTPGDALIQRDQTGNAKCDSKQTVKNIDVFEVADMLSFRHEIETYLRMTLSHF